MEPTWKSSAAGVINIMAGLASLLGGFGLLLATLFFSGAVGFGDVQPEGAAGGLSIVFVLFLLGSLTLFAFVGAGVALWGGVEALRRRSWAWAIAGSIVSFVVLFPVGVLAVVLVLMGEHEFDGREPRPSLAPSPDPASLPGAEAPA